MMIDISAIDVGDRRREDYGDVAGLAQSIQRSGLLHPIVVDASNRLVAGGRRLEACRILGWQRVEVKTLGDLTHEELHRIELEENKQRKDLTSYEESKEMLAKVEAKAAELRENTVANSPQYSGPGQPRKPDGVRQVAAALKTSPRELNRAAEHVKTAEAYPFMQKADWKQYHVLEAKEHIEKLPEAARPVFAEMINEPATPPAQAIKMLKAAAEMPAEKLEKTVRLYQSEDKADKQLAKTITAEVPPCPDDRSVILMGVIRDIKECIRLRDDEYKAALKGLLMSAEDVKTFIDKAQKERNNQRD